MIAAKDLTLIYPGEVIGVEGLDFELKTGEIVVLIGPSGAGKSSLLKLLLGTRPPTAGRLDIFHHTITRDKTGDLNELRRMISPIFQDFKLLLDKTALENVALGLRVLGYLPGKIYKESKKVLDEVGLSHKIQSPVIQLSYGERQRVAVARAIARKSRIIIADEPTGNLDAENSLRIMKLLTDLKKEDRIIIIATHEEYLFKAAGIDYKRLKIEGGRLISEKSTGEKASASHKRGSDGK